MAHSILIPLIDEKFARKGNCKDIDGSYINLFEKSHIIASPMFYQQLSYWFGTILQPNGIMQYQKAMKLDLRGHNGKIQKRKVGPFGMAVLDTAIVVSSDDK